ncbi:hypothetical protein ACFRCG_03330 [Embleya sp. NPDC056575]|uniref:hypothetical protein n=1 Tax=unclassified Embleya TaxID=2699296 RepID=UPI0036C4E45E
MPGAHRPTITPGSSDAGERPTFVWEPTERVFRTTHSVAVGEGLLLWQAREFAQAADGVNRMRKAVRYATLPVRKRAARVPTYLRPEKTLVDTGADVVLSWDGPDDLDSPLVLPDGREEPTQTVAPGSYRRRPSADAATVHVRDSEFETLTADTAIHTPRIQGTTAGGRFGFTDAGVHVENPGGAGAGTSRPATPT